ncbi:MAG: hypothetical protein QXQ66_07145 [Candidatus Hadarchaeum sp.]
MIGIVCTTDLKRLRQRLIYKLGCHKHNDEVKYHDLDLSLRPTVFFKLAKIIDDLNCFITGIDVGKDQPKDPYSTYASTIISHIFEWVSNRSEKEEYLQPPPLHFIIDPTTSLDVEKFNKRAGAYAGNIKVNDPIPNSKTNVEIWAADIVAGALIDIFINNDDKMKSCFRKLVEKGNALDPKEPPVFIRKV